MFFSHFISCSQTVSCPAVTSLLSLPLFCTSFLITLPPCSISFCTMPQGPPGPQGSPHPQPPPPNSMMGAHSQVMLRLSLFFSFLGVLVLSADASCFGIHHSSPLHPVLPQTNTKCIDIYWSESHGALLFFLSQSFMSPRFAGGPRGPPIRMGSQVEVACMYTS